MLDVLEYIKKDQNLENIKHTILYGEDVYFIQYFEQLLKNKYDTKTYWADELNYESLRDIALTKNMFSNKTIFIIKNFTELFDKLKKENIEFIKKTSNIFIFEEYKDLTEKDLSKVKSVIEDVLILTSKRRKLEYLKSLIQKKFIKENIELKQDILDGIIKVIGLDSLNLKNETDKLLLLAKSMPITKDTVVKSLVKEPSDEAFSVVDALLSNNAKRALSIFYDSIKLGQHPLLMLGFIQKQFINMYLAFKIDKDFDEICKILNINHPFQKTILSKQMSMIKDKKDRLFDIIKIIKEADMGIKYYFQDPTQVLEKLIIDIALILKI